MIRFTSVGNSKTPVLSEPLPVPSLPAKTAACALRLVAISDTHTYHEQLVLPDADALIHCGDFTDFCWPWEVRAFNSWLGRQQHIPHRFLVAGNHDRFETVLARMITNATLLSDSSVQINGVSIHGSRFKISEGFLGSWSMGDRRAKRSWDEIPEHTDILVTHQPPANTPFTFPRGNKHLGVTTQRIRPPLHLFGHIHSYYGLYHIPSTKEDYHDQSDDGSAISQMGYDNDGENGIDRRMSTADRTLVCASSRKGKSSEMRPPIVIDYYHHPRSPS